MRKMKEIWKINFWRKEHETPWWQWHKEDEKEDKKHND